MTTGKVKTVIQTTDSLPAVKYAEKIAKYIEPRKNKKFCPIVIWMFGATGSGKSRISHEIASFLEEDYFTNSDPKWFDGYDANKVAILEELRVQEWNFPNLLKMLDRFPYRVQVKGGMRQWVADYIFINTCQNPKEIYICDEKIDQLLRRITLLIGTKVIGTEVVGNECTTTSSPQILKKK